MPIIGLDAGHGGADPGAIGVSGIYEKNLTLELAKMVQARLEKQSGFTVIMTRETDTNPGDVNWRANHFVKNKCAYALSIHFNASTAASANGTELYVPFGEAYGNVEGKIMPGILKLFSGRVPVYRSAATAADGKSLGAVYDKKLDAGTLRFGYSSALKDHFGVIRTSWASGVSADLLEVCFITNQSDLQAYLANKDVVADTIARGIVEGFGKVYEAPAAPSNTALAEAVLRADIAESKLAEIYALYERLKEE